MTRPGAHGGLVLRLALLLTGLALGLGLLVLGGAGILLGRVEQGRERESMETLLTVASASATSACFANDDGVADQVVNDLVATRRVALATIRSERTVLAEARLEGTTPGPLRFRRKLFSPFNPDLQVGELILAPAPGWIERNTALGGTLLAATLGAWLLALAALLALTLQRALYVPFRDQVRAVQALDPAGQERLQPGLGHRRDEFGRLAEAVNGLLDRFQLTLGALREEQARLLQDRLKTQAILDTLDTGLFVLRGDGRLDTWTPALLRLLDLQHAPPKAGLPIQELFGPAADAAERCLARCRAEGAEATEVFQMRRPPPDHHVWLKLRLRPIGPDWIQGQLEERRLQGPQGADDVDGHDLATGALNRFGADRAIEDHLANRITGLGLLLVELDPDQPEEAVRRLTLPLAPGDQVARLDPGKYLVLMEDLEDPEGARTLGRRIQAGLEAPWPNGPTVTARFGLVTWNADDEPSRSDLLQRADAALRESRPMRFPAG